MKIKTSVTTVGRRVHIKKLASTDAKSGTRVRAHGTW